MLKNDFQVLLDYLKKNINNFPKSLVLEYLSIISLNSLIYFLIKITLNNNPSSLIEVCNMKTIFSF